MIVLEHISKYYKSKERKYLGRFFVNKLVHGIRHGLFGKKAKQFAALDDVSLTIQPGEHIGIIGKNKAGKTTLLQIMSGITEPTSGRLEVSGIVMPAFAQGAIITPDLSGREYIYLHAAAMGISKKITDSLIEEIISFSGITTIDTPVKFYSTGMRTRLTLSVTLFLPADVYVFDEVFYGSDTFFKDKVTERLKKLLLDPGKIIILVSHNEDILLQFCKRMILLDHGKIKMDGNVDEVLNYYNTEYKEEVVLNNS